MVLAKDQQDILDAYATKAATKAAEKGRSDETKAVEATSMMEALGPLLTESVLDAAMAKARGEDKPSEDKPSEGKA